MATEGQAYKAAAKVAGDLRGFLEGSTQVNPRKGGAGTVACIRGVPQVRAGAGAALGSPAICVHMPHGHAWGRCVRSEASSGMSLSMMHAWEMQVHGAAEAALSAAGASVAAELTAGAPAPDKLVMEAPAVQLAEDLLSLARRLATAAAGSLARCQLYYAAAPDSDGEVMRTPKSTPDPSLCPRCSRGGTRLRCMCRRCCLG